MNVLNIDQFRGCKIDFGWGDKYEKFIFLTK